MNAPENILYIIPRPEIGGAERQLLLLLRGLDRNRFRPHVVCLDGGGSLLPDYRDAAEHVHVLNRRRTFDLRTLASLVRIVREVRPALVHTWLYIANLYGGWAARLAGVPALIVSQRGLGIDPQHSRFKIWQMRIFNLLIAQFADRLLVNARAVAHPMWRVGFDPNRTRVIPNGIQTYPYIPAAQRNALRRELNLREGQILLGAIAHINPKKDLATMLLAVARVVQTRPNLRLLIVGGGFPHYLKELEALAQSLKIQRNVDFLGSRNDPLAVLSLCDVSLLSSLTEGLPNAILESMLLGKPVVATRVGGVPELIENSVEGWLVPPGDSEQFADRILDLIDNPARAAQMGAAGQTRALRDFSAKVMVHNTQAVYDELMEENNSINFSGLDPSPDPSPIGEGRKNHPTTPSKKMTCSSFPLGKGAGGLGPLNILTVTSIYPIHKDPGLGAFVASQVASLRKAGLGVDVLFLDARRSKWELVRGIARVRIRAASGVYDLVHAHFGYNGIPACLQSRLPVVVSFCGTDLNGPRLRPISRWVARRADACIVKSDRLREVLGHPAVVIPNGVDTNRFRPAPRNEARRHLGLRPDARYALFLSDPARPEKRHNLAQAAVASARKLGLPLELLVLHNRPQSELPGYLSAADLLLLTSSREGSPNTVKEAMACNLPIVSTDVGDVRQVLGKAHNCAVCDPIPNDLARGIQTVLNDGARSNGRARISHLASDTIAVRIVEVYRRALEEGGRS